MQTVAQSAVSHLVRIMVRIPLIDYRPIVHQTDHLIKTLYERWSFRALSGASFDTEGSQPVHAAGWTLPDDAGFAVSRCGGDGPIMINEGNGCATVGDIGGVYIGSA